MHNTPDSNSALTSGSGSDTAQRRVKHDFAQADPCPNGAACSKHPFLESWTFGKNPNGDIVALSPKKGPFCQHNHSKEADGELTEDQLSKKKMISEAKNLIRESEAARAAVNTEQEAFVGTEVDYLTEDSDEDEDDEYGHEAYAGMEEEGEFDNISEESESASERSEDDSDNDDENSASHLNDRALSVEESLPKRPTNDIFEPRTENESKVAKFDSRVRAGTWNAQRSTKTSDGIKEEKAQTFYLKDSIYLAIIAVLIAFLVGAFFTPFITAAGLSPITGNLNGTAPNILVSDESASAVNSTEPANRDNISLVLMVQLRGMTTRQVVAETEAETKTEAEAKAKVEAEAKADKAEAVAKAKAEAEAKADKAEAEVIAKNEAEIAKAKVNS